MADIFISYSSDDFERVKELATALESSGLSVWWDRNLHSGARFSKVIEDEIALAKAVLVVWSATSIDSQWVADEAALGRDDNKLLPIALDGVLPPLGFRQIQVLDFSNWQGSPEESVFVQLLGSFNQETPPAKTDDVSHQSTTQKQTESPIQNSLLLKRGAIVAAGLVAVLAIFTATSFFNNPLNKTQTGNLASQNEELISDRNFDGRGAIAVMPFINLSGNPEQEYFPDGITEDLIFTLHSYRLFPIIARTSTFTYKGVSKDVPTIASELGASYLITGSVRRSDGKVRIAVQLLDAKGRTLWANNYDIEWTDTYSVQDQIVASIIAEIDSELILNEVDRANHSRPEDMTAWDYYLKARSLTATGLGWLNINGKMITPEENEEARQLLLKAIELEPDFAGAYALLIGVEGAYSGQFGMHLTEQERALALEKSNEYAKKAERLNPFEAVACSCQAVSLQIMGQGKQALKMQERALRDLPSSSLIHASMAKILEDQGMFERALREIATAKRLSPRDLDMSVYHYIESAIYLGLGDFESALELAEESLYLVSKSLDAHAMRIMALYGLGRHSQAQQALKELEAQVPDFRPSGLWQGAFHPAIANTLPPRLGEQAKTARTQEGFRLILIDLGWDEGSM